MRKWLVLAVQVPFLAMVWAGCSGDDTSGDAGDAQTTDVKIDKKVAPETGPDDSGPAACMPSATIDSSQIKWVPPNPAAPNACSDAEIQAMYSDCFDPKTKSSKKCQGFQQTSSGCYACLITPQSASSYGALIAIGGVDHANIAGCIALLTGDTSDTGCGAKSLARTSCETLACSENCPAVTDDSSFAEYQKCTSAADTAVCKPYVDAQCDLSDAGNVYTTCVNHPDFASYYAAVAPVFCGGYPADAGAGDAGTDASMTDATTDAPDDAPDGD